MTSNMRNYDNCLDSVIECYRQQRLYQNYDFVNYAINKYCIFNRISTFQELFANLKIVDLSDPDINLSNDHHLYQTAEGIRRDGHPEWMQLVGLIHDLGKIMYLKGCDEDGTSEKTQWALVGDTFITGCQIPNSITLSKFNNLNKDMHNPKYSSKYGIYRDGIGLNNVLCSFGHDEYLYRLLKFNKVNLPEEGYYMIRFHSLYLWHKENEYSYLEDETDKKMKPWVQLFNKYDLYTKENIEQDKLKLREYYNKLIQKFLPNKIYW